MITYAWSIKSFKKQNNNSNKINDIIVQTYWTCIGTDESGNSGVFHGATPFDPNAVDSNNFIPYENLTEDHIISWIQDSVNANQSYKDHIYKQIQKQIDEANNSITDVNLNDMPWI